MASLHPRERVAGSCDYCRQNKTKCIRSESGCRRCLRAGRTCITSNTKTGRPYYQSSKEQYDLMASVVHHFLPATSLDKESLREVVAQLSITNQTGGTEPAIIAAISPPPSSSGTAFEGGMQSNSNSLDIIVDTTNLDVEAPTTSTQSLEDNTQAQDLILTGSTPGQQQSSHVLTPTSVPRDNDYSHDSIPHHYINAASGSTGDSLSHPSASSNHTETLLIESVVRRDDSNTPRYDSGTSWPAFFSKITANVGPQYDALVHNPLLVLDDDGPSKPLEMVSPVDLPPRTDFEQAAQKFFAELNCVTYILSYEQFQSHLICAFDQKSQISHSVFMLLNLIVSFSEDVHAQYFSKACEHLEYVLEEGTVESVESLMLLALCRMDRGQKNLAWISIGCASRIAQTLGLHLDESCWEVKSQVAIEDRKRLWWSLYDLEICLAYRLGRLPGIDLASCHVGLPSETVFNLVPNSPPGYHRVIGQLSTINGSIIQDLYGPRSAEACLDSRADELVDELQCFWEDLPQHLKPDAHIAPSHCRAVLYLGLRYNYTILLATRPSVVACWKAPYSCSPSLMRRVEMSEEANKRSLVLLKTMAQMDVLNHKSYLDAPYILANMLMFILRMVKEPSLELLNEASEYDLILQGTQNLAIGRAAIRAFKATMEDVKSMLSKGQLQQGDFMFVDDFLQDFVGVDEMIWSTWPSTVPSMRAT